MGTDLSYIDENYKRIVYNVGEAKARYRQNSDEIRIMAVTKTVTPEAVNHAVDLGLTLLGENRVQEYMSKKDMYSEKAEVQFIGALQTNKVKYIIDSVTLIQSVTGLKLAQEIDKRAGSIGRICDVLIEVNIGDEVSKTGTDISQLDELIHSAAELSNIRIKGLMTIPPIENAEKHLCRMQEIFEKYKQESIEGVRMDILSMGMSGDYVEAIKYGSNLIRIGRGLFGPREYR